MSIRTEIETKLATFAAAQVPPIPVAYENVAFTKPTTGRYLEIHFLDSASKSRNVEANGKRVTGMFQINCYAPLGKGMASLEALRDAVVALYPVVPKMETVSIEAPLSWSGSFVQDAFICIPITGQYRSEF
jgi:hypothetical protein